MTYEVRKNSYVISDNASLLNIISFIIFVHTKVIGLKYTG